MRWVKQGVLVDAPIGVPWSASHAAVPHVDVRSEDSLRIYFTTRDERGRSQIARAEVHGALIRENLRLEPAPVLSSGPPGLFDDSGVMTSCLVRHEAREHLYYQGWSLGVSVPYYVFGGCAVSDRWRRDLRARRADARARPLADRPILDFVALGVIRRRPLAHVVRRRSRLGISTTGRAEHYRVHIRYAESDDGIAWRRDGHVCIDFASADEYAWPGRS